MNMNLIEEYKRKISIIKEHIDSYGVERLYKYITTNYDIEGSISSMDGKAYIISLPFSCKMVFRVIDDFEEVKNISTVEGKMVFHVVKHYILDIGIIDMYAKELCSDLEFYEYKITESNSGIDENSKVISKKQCRDIINKLLKDIDRGVEFRIRNW